MKYSKKRRFGNLGEDVACLYLKKHGFLVKDRNYLKPWGEIDIIATKDNIWYFFEVKTVSYETYTSNVARENVRPEENIHKHKLERLRRVIETYISEHQVPSDATLQVDALIVRANMHTRKATVERIEHIL